METIEGVLERLVSVGGREPRQVVRTMLVYAIILYTVRKFSNSVSERGLQKTLMGLAFFMWTKYKGKSGIAQQFKEIEEKVEEALIKPDVRALKANLALPAEGQDPAELLATLRTWAAKERRHWDGSEKMITGGVYHGGRALQDLQNDAFALYSLSNPLHPETFPFVRKMESEVVAMTLALLDGDVTRGNCGMVTSGGTESIILAIRAYKVQAEEQKGITRPELVFPVTAHAAFEKACDLMDIKAVIVPVDRATQTVTAAAMRAHMTRNTIAIVGSAPNFPCGTMDPIAALSKLALEHAVGLHVDCCLGSFLLPTVARMRLRQVPTFTFQLPGVTTMSCDTHKFGYACKGSSVILFRNKELRHGVYFCYPEWTGGMYATPTLAGSRSGGVVAATWTAMMHLGVEGYEQAARDVMGVTDVMLQAVRDTPHIRLVGDPVMSVFAFEAVDPKQLNVFHVSDAMAERGWGLGNMQNPSCVHMCATYTMKDSGDKFSADLTASVEEAMAHPEKFKNATGTIYGTIIAVPDAEFKSDILRLFLDVMYKADV